MYCTYRYIHALLHRLPSTTPSQIHRIRHGQGVSHQQGSCQSACSWYLMPPSNVVSPNANLFRRASDWYTNEIQRSIPFSLPKIRERGTAKAIKSPRRRTTHPGSQSLSTRWTNWVILTPLSRKGRALSLSQGTKRCNYLLGAKGRDSCAGERAKKKKNA